MPVFEVGSHTPPRYLSGIWRGNGSISGNSTPLHEDVGSSPAESSISVASEPTIPSEDPPTYQQARFPTQPIKYSFSQASFNSMLVVPPTDYPDSRAVYHVSVNLNCFMPSAFRTVVRKGESEDDELVAQFQLGIINVPATLRFRGMESPIGEHLYRQERPHRRTWRWRHSGRDFFWVLCGGVDRVCTLNPIRTDKPLAKLCPSDSLGGVGTTLEVFPEGQPVFDDILVSALIIEKQRLTPVEQTKGSSGSGQSGLWNFRP